MTSMVALGGHDGLLPAASRRAAHATTAQASSACAWSHGQQPVVHPDHQQRRAARLGGARPSLDEVIMAMLDGANDQCLVCASTVTPRRSDGAITCVACESVLVLAESPELAELQQAA